MARRPPIEPRTDVTKGKWYEFRTYHLRQGVLAQTIEAWREALPARTALSPLR